jgi:hypothetical protein
MNKEISSNAAIAAVAIVVLAIALLLFRQWSYKAPSPPLNPAVTGGAGGPGPPPAR